MLPTAASLCVVVMGVSGSGKSRVGQALASALGLTFVEGDDWHSPANVARMAAGQPLDDADRADWLQALAGRLGAAQSQGRNLDRNPGQNPGLVLACSALKRRYRDQLRQGAPRLLLLHLQGEPALIAQRLARRSGHFMPASLLPSQLEALEPPQPDETALVLDIAAPFDELVAAAQRWLRAQTGISSASTAP